ncbi:MAG TPA: copper amine oxidase N-terminal domain-containing protein [Bacillales bacterium]|nr:copper amine oxidase N-terminal domain-containing protein [Bacillales bacterium]
MNEAKGMEIIMKIKNIIISTLCILIITNVFASTFTSAATLKINFINLLSNDELEKLEPTDPDKIIVTEIDEDQKYYYFLLTDESIAKGIAILKVKKLNFSIAEIISVYDSESLKGFTIESMSIGSNETIWLNLSGNKNQRSCRIDNTGKITNVDYAYNSLTKHGTESVLWLENESNIIQRWDGEQIQTYKILNQNVLDFTEHENQIYYLDNSGNVNLIDKSGETQIAYLPSVLNMKDIILETGSLKSAGGKLWTSGGIMYDPNGSINFLNTGLINLSDHTIISDVSAAKIYRTIENADGSLYFLTDRVRPITPHSSPGDDTLQGIILTKNSESIVNTVNGYWESIKQTYTDQSGNVWTYNLRGENRGVIMTAADQTTIHYYFGSSSKKPDIKVKFNEAEVEFDVNPYIENGRTMVPFRGIADLFGAATNWDVHTQTVIIQKDKVIIKLTSGKKKAYINGQEVFLEVPVEIKKGRIMVPLRFVGESLSIKADWDDSTRTILLKSK